MVSKLPPTPQKKTIFRGQKLGILEEKEEDTGRQNATPVLERYRRLTRDTEGVENSEDAAFYNGKRVAFVYRTNKEVRGTKIRVIWGKITR